MQPQQMSVTIDRLVLDEANARKKYDKDSIVSMKASILADGIIMPLAVRPPVATDSDLGGQVFRVFAGGRRMRAAAELVAEKKLPADFAVPIIVRDADDVGAAGMSLAENIIRHGMEPVDEFRAFKQLADKGLSVEEIALRYGQTERFVNGRLALGALHPTILAALEAEEINLAAACAYTLNPDQKAQISYYKSNKGWSRGNAYQIKVAMRGEALRADSSVAEFIGEERYVQAGGEIRADLFGDDVFWPSTKVIDRLKAERIAEEREKALLDGWQFFETTKEFGEEIHFVRTLAPEPAELSEEEQARMAAINADLDGVDYNSLSADKRASYDRLSQEYDEIEARMSRFTAEQKACSGVVLDVERLEFKYGAIRPKKAASKDGSATPAAAEEKPKRDPLALTQPLKDMIGNTATAALREALANRPHQALALLAAMLDQAGNHTMGIGRPSRIQVQRVNYGDKPERKTREIKAAFLHYEKMLDEELAAALAGLIAESADLSEAWFGKDFTSEERRASTRTSFLTALEADLPKHFDAAAYFASATKPMIDAAMREMTGHAAVKPKKSQMAEEAAGEARARGWLPKPLRLKSYKLTKG